MLYLSVLTIEICWAFFFLICRNMYSSVHHSFESGVANDELQGPLDGTNLSADACLVLSTDPKPRLRWTAELHERFVDAVTQLGGPDS